MWRLIVLIIIALSFACAPKAPQHDIVWYVDPWKSPWEEYVKDKEACSRYADAAFPITGEERKRSYLNYRHQLRLTYYLDCMQKKGHRVYFVNKGEDYDYPGNKYPVGSGTTNGFRKSWPINISN